MTVVILAAELAARTVLPRRAALRHRLWFCCLICILVGPAVAMLLDRAGIGLAVIPWTGSATTSMANVVSPGTRADTLVADGSELGFPIYSAAGTGFDGEQSDGPGAGFESTSRVRKLLLQFGKQSRSR